MTPLQAPLVKLRSAAQEHSRYLELVGKSKCRIILIATLNLEPKAPIKVDVLQEE